jgi:hypothetical protein
MFLPIADKTGYFLKTSFSANKVNSPVLAFGVEPLLEHR